VQEALLVALQSGRVDLPWLMGVLKNLGAMAGRSAARRRRRELATPTFVAEREAFASEQPGSEQVASEPPASRHAASTPFSSGIGSATAALPPLPPSARRVAVLALHGLSADEIRWILTLTPTAFRQRLSVIRRALGALAPAQRAESLALAYVRDPARSVDLQFGLVRRALKAALRGTPGLATHDADGHLLVLRAGAHTSSSGGNE
jgi:RNA polymerase sigma-70 factor (ECF subfamily)